MERAAQINENGNGDESEADIRGVPSFWSSQRSSMELIVSTINNTSQSLLLLPPSVNPDLSDSSTSPLSLLSDCPNTPPLFRQLYHIETQSSDSPSLRLDNSHDEMAQLIRSFSGGSNLSVFSDVEDESVTSLDPIREERGLTPEEEATFRAKLRGMIMTAKSRAQQNYDAAIAGHSMVQPHIWNEMDEIEELKRRGEEVKWTDSATKVLMPCGRSMGLGDSSGFIDYNELQGMGSRASIAHD